MTIRYLDLARTFQPVDPSGSLENLALESYTRKLRGQRPETWNSLLQHRLVVVLGEPGCGKTREFKEKAKAMMVEGKLAFFLPLDRLVSDDISLILTEEESKAFTQWMKGGRQFATFFLDSVDEAKFKGVHEFHYAFSRFAKQLGESISRATILISSRISEWNPESDLNEVLSKLPPRSKPKSFSDQQEEDSKSQDHLIVVIQPLSNDQVKAFCLHLGLGNIDDFTAALTKEHAWEFARRPIDVIDLITLWKERGRLGSLTEILESTLEHGLRESSERERLDPLTPLRARNGAETLGASNILCKEIRFSIGDGATLSVADSIDPRSCLPTDWSMLEVRALMTRPVFDGASYGTIRFHHRRLTEFLAASWFARLMDRGCELESLISVLFDRRGKEPILRPELEPVTAWMCGHKTPWAEILRDIVLKTNPWSFFKYGDPNSLPLDYRAKVIKAVVENFKDRENVLIDLDLETLSRFGDPAFERDLIKYIADRTTPDDLRSDLLMIASESGLTSCVPTCLEIVKDDSQSESVKCTALFLIRKLADRSSLDSLSAIISSQTKLTSRLSTYVCQALFPYPLDADGLVAILEKTESVRKHSVDLPYFLQIHVKESMKDEEAEGLFWALYKLWGSSPHINVGGKELSISSKFYWIGDIIVLPMIKLLQREGLSDKTLDALAEGVLMVLEFRSYIQSIKDIPEEFDSSLSSNMSVRQRCYWKLVEEGKSGAQGLQYYWWVGVLGAHDELHPTIRDLDWMVQDSRLRKNEHERAMILRHAVQVCFARGSRMSWLARYFRLVGWDKEGIREVIRYISGGLKRQLHLFWDSHARYRKLRHHWYNKLLRGLRKFYYKVKNIIWLQTHIRLLRTGEVIGTINAIISKCNLGKKNDHHLTANPWAEVRRLYGSRVSLAVKEGAKSIFWSFSPTLPIDRKGSQSLPVQYGIGLTGAQALIDDDEIEFPALNFDQAARFATFALNEMNGFPPWLSDLATAQPTVVREIVLREITGEWLLQGSDLVWSQVLNHLVWQGGALKDLLVGDLLDLLAGPLPEGLSALSSALSVVLEYPELFNKLEDILEKQLGACKPKADAYPLMISTLLQINPERGFLILEKCLATEGDPAGLMTKLASSLFGNFPGGVKVLGDAPLFHPRALRKFIPILFKYIRVEEDLHRENQGVFSPNDRDHAQRFRDGLLQRLAHSTDPGALPALKELTDEPGLVQRRDWLLHLQYVNRRQTASLAAWAFLDVRRFESNGELVPRTDEELFQVGIRRLRDIKSETEHGDQSRREDLHPDDKEPRLRRWFASELTRRANGQFSLSQEEELDGRDYPDIRLHLQTCHPLPIELKWAENWSLNDLVERLQNQLIGQYLRDNKSRFGIFLLGYIGKKDRKQWRDTDGNLYDFEGLISYLQTRAAEFVDSNDEIFGVKVIGVNFSS